MIGPHARCGPDCPIIFAQRINYVWDLYKIHSNGTGLVNLTQSGATDVYPAWSPDHTKIAFYSERDTAGIYIMDADGAHARHVLAYDVYHLTWSPNGQRLAFLASSDLGYDIFVVNADGKGLINITHSGAAETAPAWSPRGALIAYNRENQIWVMGPDGKGQRSLTSWQTAAAFDPAWSPDGSRIVFASTRDGPFNLYIMAAEDTGWTRLTTTSGPADRVPSWSPDGSQIVFQRDFSDSVGVYVVNADGSNVRRLAGGISGQPSW